MIDYSDYTALDLVFAWKGTTLSQTWPDVLSIMVMCTLFTGALPQETKLYRLLFGLGWAQAAGRFVSTIHFSRKRRPLHFSCVVGPCLIASCCV